MTLVGYRRTLDGLVPLTSTIETQRGSCFFSFFFLSRNILKSLCGTTGHLRLCSRLWHTPGTDTRTNSPLRVPNELIHNYMGRMHTYNEIGGGTPPGVLDPARGVGRQCHVHQHSGRVWQTTSATWLPL